MANLTMRIIISFLLYCTSQTHFILAENYYCEWGSCLSEEYCCGPNVCCAKSSGILVVLIWTFVSVTAAVIIYFLYKNRSLYRKFFLSHPEEKPIIA